MASRVTQHAPRPLSCAAPALYRTAPDRTAAGSRTDAGTARHRLPRSRSPTRRISLGIFVLAGHRARQHELHRLGRTSPYAMRGSKNANRASRVHVHEDGGAQDRIHDIPAWDYQLQYSLRLQPGAAGLVLGTSVATLTNCIVRCGKSGENEPIVSSKS